MKILDDILSSLDFNAVISEVRQGPFQTAVVSHRCGLAATLHDVSAYQSYQERAPVREAGRLLGWGAREMAGLAYSTSLPEASIGMAAINSLIEVDRGRLVELDGLRMLEEKGRGRKVAVVGHFPFVAGLRGKVGELWVFEKNPRPGDLPEDRAEDLLPEAEVVAITGSAFTNHTLEGLLRRCRPGAFILVLGGTAPLSPVLFDYGIDAISGTVVNDKEIVLKCVSQGATYRQLKGVSKLTMTRGTYGKE